MLVGWKALECWDGDRARVGAVKTGIGSEGIHRTYLRFPNRICQTVQPAENHRTFWWDWGSVPGIFNRYFIRAWYKSFSTLQKNLRNPMHRLSTVVMAVLPRQLRTKKGQRGKLCGWITRWFLGMPPISLPSNLGVTVSIRYFLRYPIFWTRPHVESFWTHTMYLVFGAAGMLLSKDR